MFVPLLIMVFPCPIVSGKLFVLFLFDLNMMKDVFSTFRVSLFAVNHFLTFLIIFSAFSISDSRLMLWQNIPVSSANILNKPSLQEFAKSFMYIMNNNGPNTDP